MSATRAADDVDRTAMPASMSRRISSTAALSRSDKDRRATSVASQLPPLRGAAVSAGGTARLMNLSPPVSQQLLALQTIISGIENDILKAQNDALALAGARSVVGEA